MIRRFFLFKWISIFGWGFLKHNQIDALQKMDFKPVFSGDAELEIATVSHDTTPAFGTH
jgi:hypothetical protein